MEGDAKKQRGLLKAIFLAFIFATVIKVFLVDLMVTQGRSMLPALQPGSVLVVNKLAYGIRLPVLGIYILRWSAPRSGDMVVFYTPLGERAVKRCYYVREGNFYALGDNGLESFDSRSYGPISLDHILGKVVAVR
ncbi:MAG: signal peptidase I [Spirochaetaceae bacterium]|jgi:signal peptidase I|nr:signal peptidase I [Spirochaetaceae bacterium]